MEYFLIKKRKKVIYIKTLFNNYPLFKPNIQRKKRSKQLNSKKEGKIVKKIQTSIQKFYYWEFKQSKKKNIKRFIYFFPSDYQLAATSCAWFTF